MASTNAQSNPTRLYDYTKIFGEVTKNFDSYFELPKLTVYNQFDSNLCVGYALATAAEILWGKRFSAGWNYGKFRDDTHKGTGLYLIKALEYLHKIGTVPLVDFRVFEDVPKILNLVNERPELLEIAKNYRIEGYCNLKFASKTKRDLCIKDALSRYKEGVAVVATSSSYFWQNHCIAIVGWNDETDSYIFQNTEGIEYKNEGRGEIPKDEIDTIYAVFATPIELPFKDVEPTRWSYKHIKNLYMSDIMNGVSEDTFDPTSYLTREQAAVLIDRVLEKVDEQNERNAIINYQKEMLT